MPSDDILFITFSSVSILLKKGICAEIEYIKRNLLRF
jgi:hypothetical protein